MPEKKYIYLACTKSGAIVPGCVAETRRDAIVAVRKMAHKYAGSSVATQVAWMRQCRIIKQELLGRQSRRRQKGRNTR